MKLNSSITAVSSIRCLVAFVLAAVSACAQVSAILSGTVTDPSGAAISAATVTAKNVDTGAVRGAVTDAAGHYQFFSLPVGQYEIHGGKSGFTEEVRTGVHLVVGQSATVDMQLPGRRIEPAGHRQRRRAAGGCDHRGHLGPGG